MAGILSALLGGDGDQESVPQQETSILDDLSADVGVSVAVEHEYQDVDGSTHGGRTEASVSDSLGLDGLLSQDSANQAG